MRLLARAESMRDFNADRSIMQASYHENPACKAGFSWCLNKLQILPHRDAAEGIRRRKEYQANRAR